MTYTKAFGSQPRGHEGVVLDGAELFGVPLHERDLLRVKYGGNVVGGQQIIWWRWL